MNIAQKPIIPAHLFKRKLDNIEPVVKPKLKFKPGGRVDWTDKSNIEMVASRVRSGMLAKEIAKELSVTVGRINHCMKRYRIKGVSARKRDRPLTPCDWDLIIALRVVKVSIADCANAIEINPSILSNELFTNKSAQMLIKQKRQQMIDKIVEQYK